VDLRRSELARELTPGGRNALEFWEEDI